MKSQMLFDPKSDKSVIRPFERWVEVFVASVYPKEHQPKTNKLKNQKKFLLDLPHCQK